MLCGVNVVLEYCKSLIESYGRGVEKWQNFRLFNGPYAVAETLRFVYPGRYRPWRVIYAGNNKVLFAGL